MKDFKTRSRSSGSWTMWLRIIQGGWESPSKTCERENSCRKASSSSMATTSRATLKYPDPGLENNRHMAEVRLKYLERRLKKDSNLAVKYTETVQGYIEKGFAEKVPRQEKEENLQTSCTWYLPHHPVVHPHKPAKVRVVFDCAAKYRGTSLNDTLLQGPDHTNKLLVGVLLRFRQEPVAVVGDVEAMFHQVKVPKKDCDALRFLWWENGNLATEPVEYQMKVHLFGATSSPSCAGFALRRTAEDNRHEYDEDVVNTVLDNFYVDDCLKSVPSDKDGVRLVQQLRGLLQKGGFRLTKWVSNSREVLNSIPEKEKAPSVIDMDLDTLPIERTLGVLWDVDSDRFGFKVSLKDRPATRRGILSKVSSLYDPLGFLAPFILVAKVLLQGICQKGLAWDEPVDEKDLQTWQEWLDDLPRLTEIKIPRCLKSLNDSKVGNFLTQKGIEWRFNPPLASHMGGVWERVIRSVRKILGGLLHQQVMSDEALVTLMTEVEAILNARPLTPLSMDPKDEEPLTPNHLLLLRNNPSLPPGIFTKDESYGRRRWRHVQFIADQFWKRWVKEYLPLLQPRQKWTREIRNFEQDDLVLVADDNAPRGQWPLGKIVATYPDKQGRVRQVEVRIGSKYFRRPISKLCLLEEGKGAP
nr:uncharacterized protein LOC129271341 [Lytechinus pictus]